MSKYMSYNFPFHFLISYFLNRNQRISIEPVNILKRSLFFEGNDLVKLGNINSLPTNGEIDIFVNQNFEVKVVLSSDDVQKYILRPKNI